MEDIEIMTLEISEHDKNIRERNSGKSVDQLEADHKKLAADKSVQANLARATFETGIELAEGRFKVLEATYPKYVKAVGYEVITTMVSKIVDNKITEVPVRKYRKVIDFAQAYDGHKISELQALKHLANSEAEDESLTPEELLHKYRIPERLAELKRLSYNNEVARLELTYRVAKVLYTLRRRTLETIDMMIAEKKAEATKAFMQKSAEWLNADGKKLFGL